MAGRREDGSAVAEERSEEDGSFDPGLETGYLRRAPRDHELDVEQGAAPFEPGPGAGYDGKRAKRAEKRREKAEKKLREQRDRAEQQRQEDERAAAVRALHEREQRERDRAERERMRLDRARELHEQNLRAQEKRLEQRRRERAGLQEERKRKAEERRERERAEHEQRERERKERAQELKAQELKRLAERERREREESLRRKREESLRKERERAERMKDQALQIKEIGPQDAGPAPQVAPAPQADKAPPATVKPVPRHSLKWPTLKVALALAALTAAAFGAGKLLGLPLPDLGSESTGSGSASLSGALALDSGTPPSLTKGPFQPVLGRMDYGAKDAKFGAPRSGHVHEGQDMLGKRGTPLVAVRDGVVVDRGKVNGPYSGGRGNYLAIYSPLDDLSFVYQHLEQPPPVSIGDEVEAGQQIGQMGCTGTCFGTNLHFEVRKGRATLRADLKAGDPLPYLRQWPQAAPAKP